MVKIKERSSPPERDKASNLTTRGRERAAILETKVEPVKFLEKKERAAKNIF